MKNIQNITAETEMGRAVIRARGKTCYVSKAEVGFYIRCKDDLIHKFTREGAAIAVKKLLGYGNLSQIEDAIKIYG